MKRTLIIHPFLFAIYPVLSVLVASLPYLNPLQALRPTVVILMCTIGLLFLFFARYRDWQRAGFLCSIFVMMLFYYGYSYRLPREINLLGISISRHYLILCFWIIFIGIVASQWLWSRVRPHVITNFMNISSSLALIVPMYGLISFLITSNQDRLAQWERPSNTSEDALKLAGEYRPDIYYIILDGYARGDVLEEMYQYDNSDFLKALESRGFYIAEDSYSNYMQTDLSLSSSLNFEYLEYLSFAKGASTNRDPLLGLEFNNRARRWLEDAGYHTYISGEYIFTERNDPDLVFYGAESRKLTTFESLLLASTIFEILVEETNLELSSYTYQTHREKIVNGFAMTKDLVESESPKFIFVHIIAPHPPFVFDRKGNHVQPDWEYRIFDGYTITEGNEAGINTYIEGYRDQLMYINLLTIDTVDYIITHSTTPPIIILQADHGPAAFQGINFETTCPKERFAILNAYYFPDGNYGGLYQTITPVNTFRVVFDTFFSTELGLIPDLNYLSFWDDPYGFSDLTGQLEFPCQLTGQR